MYVQLARRDSTWFDGGGFVARPGEIPARGNVSLSAIGVRRRSTEIAKSHIRERIQCCVTRKEALVKKLFITSYDSFENFSCFKLMKKKYLKLFQIL